MQLGVMEQSVVSELANIGCGHAATALAGMTGKAFNMSVPYVEPVTLEEIPLRLGNGEELTVAITMPIAGDAEGHMLFLMDWTSAMSLWKLLLGQAPVTLAEVSDLDASAMLEVGNIINSSFLCAISDMTGIRLESTPPRMGVDMAASLLQSLVVEATLGDHYALAIRTQISAEDGNVEGFFLYVPTLDGLRLVFKSLGLPEAA